MADNRIENESPVLTYVRETLAGGMTPAKLAEVKEMARTGTFEVIDIFQAMRQVQSDPSLTPKQREDFWRVMRDMRQTYADEQWRALAQKHEVKAVIEWLRCEIAGVGDVIHLIK